MASKQPEADGTTVRREVTPELLKAFAIACMIGDFGDKQRDELLVCPTLQSLYEQFEPTLKVDDVEIEFSEDQPPLPGIIAEILLSRDEEWHTLSVMEKWLPDASPADLAKLYHRLTISPESSN